MPAFKALALIFSIS